jgi:hypothetical protein
VVGRVDIEHALLLAGSEGCCPSLEQRREIGVGGAFEELWVSPLRKAMRPPCFGRNDNVELMHEAALAEEVRNEAAEVAGDGG